MSFIRKLLFLKMLSRARGNPIRVGALSDMLVGDVEQLYVSEIRGY